MQNHRPFSLSFPIGGLNRRHALQNQRPYTTPDCLNVWPIDVTTGRERGGVRPGLTQIASRGSDPYAWTTGVYLDSGAKEALFATFGDGTYSTLNGVSWTQRVSTAPGTDACSCAIYNRKLYQAQLGAKTRQKILPSGTEADLDDSNGGTAPENCGIVLTHGDRLWLGMDSANPQTVYASAIGDAANWDTSDITVSGAWTNTGSEGGQIGTAITAGISHNQNVLLWGSARGIYAVPGNPRSGGTRRVSSRLGPLNNNCWCKGEDASGSNNTYLLTSDGLCMIPADDYTTLVKLGSEIPNELRSVNPAAGDVACIGYDARWQGIHIAINRAGGDTPAENFFYHIPTESYWPCSYSGDIGLFATFAPLQSTKRSSILLFTNTGGVNQFDSDSEESFSSHIWFGPLRLGSPTTEGYIASITGVLADGSQDCNWSLHFGKSCEEAFLQTAAAHVYTGAKWSRESMNYTQQPRKGGYAAYLKVFDISDERWLIEEIVGEIGTRGMRRVG